MVSLSVATAAGLLPADSAFGYRGRTEAIHGVVSGAVGRAAVVHATYRIAGKEVSGLVGVQLEERTGEHCGIGVDILVSHADIAAFMRDGFKFDPRLR